MRPTSEHAIAALSLLDKLWAEVSSAPLGDHVQPLSAQIDQIFAGKEVGYKKAIIIQLVAKAADFSIDAQALQRGTGLAGAWDAREFAKRVFVPWNASIGHPLGDSDDPYVGNQFRNPRFDRSIRQQRRAVDLFDNTLAILESANAAETVEQVTEILQQILFGLRRLLQHKTFDYPVPQRASLDTTQTAVSRFLSVSSGGGRLQAVAHALFKALAHAGLDYSRLIARHVNASDTSSRSPGDVTFKRNGRAVAVEVKDRLLNAAQVSVSVTKARVADVSELIFLVHAADNSLLFTNVEEREEAERIAVKEFSSGLNLYWESYLRLSRSLLMILGEAGRQDFLKFVGVALEEQRVDAQHRWAWAQIVAEI